MAFVKCTSCGHMVEVPGRGNGPFWLIGCLVAVPVILTVVAVVGLLAAIAIPSFVRARSMAEMNACANNMRMIDAAKEQWAIEEKATAGTPVPEDAIHPFLPGAATPRCPAGGSYTYHPVDQDPECSVHGVRSSPQPAPAGGS